MTNLADYVVLYDAQSFMGVPDQYLQHDFRD